MYKKILVLILALLVMSSIDAFAIQPRQQAMGEVIESVTNLINSSGDWMQLVESFEGDDSIAFAILVGLWGLLGLLKLLMIVATVLFVVLVFKKQSKIVVQESLDNFWDETLKGLLFLVVAPVAIFLVALSVVGLPVALIAGLVYIVWLMVANIFAPIVLGTWVSSKLFKHGAWEVDWKTALLGVLAIYIVGWIPFVGWLVKLLLVLAVLGTLVRTWYQRAWLMRN